MRVVRVVVVVVVVCVVMGVVVVRVRVVVVVMAVGSGPRRREGAPSNQLGWAVAGQVQDSAGHVLCWGSAVLDRDHWRYAAGRVCAVWAAVAAGSVGSVGLTTVSHCVLCMYVIVAEEWLYSGFGDLCR